MRGRIDSLNAAVAGSILLYEASSQRGGERPLVGPEPGDSGAPEPAEPATSADPATPPEAPSSPVAEPKPRRRAATRTKPVEAPVEAPPESEENALLPGSAPIDSSDAASAE
jgi:hypothetical protein